MLSWRARCTQPNADTIITKENPSQRGLSRKDRFFHHQHVIVEIYTHIGWLQHGIAHCICSFLHASSKYGIRGYSVLVKNWEYDSRRTYYASFTPNHAYKSQKCSSSQPGYYRRSGSSRASARHPAMVENFRFLKLMVEFQKVFGWDKAARQTCHSMRRRTSMAVGSSHSDSD